MGDTAWTDPATPPLTHVTVLLDEAVDAWLTEPDGIYVDGTYGRGGHSRLLLQRLGPRGRLLALDRDPEAIASATQGSARVTDPRFHISQASFADLAQELDAQGIGQVQGVLLDVGVSSPQIDAPGRGFSFRLDGPLDMRMDPTRGDSAADFLARADERHIAEVIRQHGEERFAVSIAKALVARREGGQPVRTTRELSEIVAAAVKTREPGQNPATRTFQALRIHVNAELEALELGLDAALKRLAPKGRLVVISFHSLEDRIVKTFIARHSREVVDRRSPAYFGLVPAGADEPPLRALGRVRPSPAEVARNPRARSAIMRVAEKRAATAEAS